MVGDFRLHFLGAMMGGGQWGQSPQYLDIFAGTPETYTAGQNIDVHVVVTAHQTGHFEYHVCDRRLNSAMSGANQHTCIDNWPLLRVDPSESYNDGEADDERGDLPARRHQAS